MPHAGDPRPARRHRDDFGLILANLFGKERRVVAGGKRHDSQTRWMGVHHGQRAPADRSGRAENRQSLHVTFRT